MHILITGGAGFIGSNFVRMLLRGEFVTTPSKVTVVDALTYAGSLENLQPVTGDSRLNFVQGNIADRNLILDLMQDIDVVVNFAAESHVDRSIENPGLFLETNVLGTDSLLWAANKCSVERFVHIGTDEVYGSLDSGSWNEDSPLKPNSPYAASKAAAEHLVRAYFNTYKLNVSSTRSSNTYGQYQFPEKLIPLFVSNLMDGLSVPLYGDGENCREWLHVDDHCRAIELVLRSGKAGESYNVGGGNELSNNQLVRIILDELNADESLVVRVADRLGHDFRYSVNDSKLRKLGYQPQQEFREGISNTIKWYVENESWWRPLKRSN